MSAPFNNPQAEIIQMLYLIFLCLYFYRAVFSVPFFVNSIVEEKIDEILKHVLRTICHL